MHHWSSGRPSVRGATRCPSGTAPAHAASGLPAACLTELCGADEGHTPPTHPCPGTGPATCTGHVAPRGNSLQNRATGTTAGAKPCTVAPSRWLVIRTSLTRAIHRAICPPRGGAAGYTAPSFPGSGEIPKVQACSFAGIAAAADDGSSTESSQPSCLCWGKPSVPPTTSWGLGGGGSGRQGNKSRAGRADGL